MKSLRGKFLVFIQFRMGIDLGVPVEDNGPENNRPENDVNEMEHESK